jgi:hypothetical protein
MLRRWSLRHLRPAAHGQVLRAVRRARLARDSTRCADSWRTRFMTSAASTPSSTDSWLLVRRPGLLTLEYLQGDSTLSAPNSAVPAG